MTTTINQNIATPYFTDIFADDITVNGAKVGRGSGNVASNLAFGTSPLNSPFVIESNTAITAIGNNTFPLVGKGVATINLFFAGSGYYDDDGYTDYFTTTGQMVYLSGTPVMAGGTYPTVIVEIISGVVDSVQLISSGSGFPTTVTDSRFNVVLDGNISFAQQAVFNPLTFQSASDLIAIGNNTGSTSQINTNSIYIGNGISGTSSNEIVIGNGSNLTTTISGLLTTGGIDCGASTIGTTGNTVIGNSGFGTTVIIGGTSGQGPITLGRSTNGVQVVNIAVGANATGNKTVNIATNSTGGTTTVNIANITGSSIVSIASGTGGKTVTIGAGTTSGGTTVIIGSTAGTSTVIINGQLRQQTRTVATLGTGVAGARSFVTDASAPTFGMAVVGGGAIGVPVYHDGISWKVG